MNQHLQKILDFIQQDEKLTAEEKALLTKAAKSTDSDLSIAEFKLDRTEKVKRTTAILLEETIEELEQKRKAVEEQNRELEIEKALEKVRSAALGMKELADMVDVCHIISDQLELLNVKEIRNIQTAIFYVDKGTYFNYEYYRLHDRSLITEVVYVTHAVSTEFADRMLNKPEELFTKSLEGAALKEWYAFQRTTNQFDDTHLAHASSLNYYWYSIGPVALGISTYAPLNEDEINLFKRFRNVFELAYRRFLDIEKALAQAKEARLETALERVRAVAMAMRKPDDLLDICEILYSELDSLGFTDMRNSMINIYNDEKATFVNYDFSEAIGKSTNHLHYNIHPVIEKQIKQLRSANDAFSETVFEGKDLQDWKAFRVKIGEKDDPRINNSPALYYYFYSIGIGSIGISSFNSLTGEKLEVLKRFRNVFSLSYQRYIDISLAEAQTKEAQIQLALERVRARTMAMQKSDELPETSYVLFEQFKELGLNADQMSIGIINEEEGVAEMSVTLHGNQLRDSYKVTLDEPFVISKIHTAWKALKKSIIIELEGKDLEDYNAFRNKNSKITFNKDLYKSGPRWIVNTALFSKGWISFSSIEQTPEETIKLLERFAAVFDGTYTRFLDLKQAEAQAREAQIEAALERVRSRSMGMQKSEELKEVIKIVYQQLIHLKINLDHTGFVVDYTARGDWHFWIADEHDIPSKITHPYFESVWANQFNEAKEKGADSFATNLNFEEKNKFYNELLSYVPGLPEASKDFYLSCPGLAASTLLFDNVSLYIENFSGIPYSDEENKIFMRFGKVFQQTYTRFLDLQKAEAQAREAKIEAALERTRTQSMIMQHSKELDETLRVFHEQVQLLGIHSAFSFLWLPDEEKEKHIFWAIWEEDKNGSIVFKNKAINYPLDRNEPATRQCLIDWKGDEQVVSYAVPPEGVKNYFAAWQELIDGVEKLKPEHFRGGLYYVEAFMKYGCFGVIMENDLTETEKKILGRFATEFERTYTRFLDLQKAEAQAREAQIEVSVERVRAQSMAMHQTIDLNKVNKELYNQLQWLKVDGLTGVSIYFIDEDGEVKIWDLSSPGNMGEPNSYTIKFSSKKHVTLGELWQHYKKEQDYFTLDYPLEKLKAGVEEFREIDNNVANALEAAINSGSLSHQWNAFGRISNGLLGIDLMTPPSEDTKTIVIKMAGAFNLAYKRFLDLQKAEAQARESQIQLALERVRARTMAMQHSNDLADTASILFQQIKDLGFETWSCGFCTWQKDDIVEVWMGAGSGGLLPPMMIPYKEEPTHHDIYEASMLGEAVHEKVWKGKALEKYYAFLRTIPSVATAIKQLEDAGLTLPTIQCYYAGFFKQGYLLLITKETNVVLHDLTKKFANVFEQTYTRFLDLQKAEAQGREAKIEAALEKVRSRSLAMHKSDEIGEVVFTVVEKMKELNIELGGISLVTFIPGSNDVMHWYVNPDIDGNSSTMFMPYFDNPVINDTVEAKEKGMELLVKMYSKEEKNNYINAAIENSDFKYFPEEIKQWILDQPYLSFSYAIQKHSGIYLEDYTGKLFTNEENNILIRFSRVFEQSYVRFLDLQKAEAQARESQIETALERVRSRTLAMQRSHELAETAAVLFQQLIYLGIAPNRLYIAIIEDKNGQTEFWITDEDGTKVSTAFHTNLNDNGSFKKMLDGWKQEKRSLIIDMQGNELQEYFKYLSSINVSFKTGLTQKKRIQHVAYFSKGFIGMACPDDQSQETMLLLERFAAVFNLTFTRFNDLKVAEAHAVQAEEDLIKLQTEKKRAEDALTNLQAAQKQLVQSEKMASLGELTAGIAHEIQNPLNFVNNFSEVSKELLDEMKIELDKGNIEDAKEIMTDVIQNLEKINHHGKRADGIVKGMLQHSRTSNGQKELTDINALADEYLRLSYHGLRAKDKSFNATIKTDLDPSLEKINIIPQDIGRVILNLLTNAFYVVNEKKQMNIPGYEPIVSVTTKRSLSLGEGRGEVQIKVIDNGHGIPQKVMDKIFQPFFTTKPTGQGTGLGLSLSYDIITKGHNGELKVETKEGEGTTFIIQLPIS